MKLLLNILLVPFRVLRHLWKGNISHRPGDHVGLAAFVVIGLAASALVGGGESVVAVLLILWPLLMTVWILAAIDYWGQRIMNQMAVPDSVIREGCTREECEVCNQLEQASHDG